MRAGSPIARRLLEPRIKLATVAGILTTRPRLIEWLDRAVPQIEIITTKSYQVRPNPGNREPVVVEQAEGCYGNAVGLRNPGLEQGVRELAELRRRRPLRALLNVSLSANCIEDFLLLARRFAPVADLLELNFSCPHAASGYGAAIGSDPCTVAAFLRALRRALPDAALFPKLTPNVADIGAIARAAVAAGADGISAINTVGPEVFREPHSGATLLSGPEGRGGKSGEWIKETARRQVAEIRAAVGPVVPIIGMGGVSSADDVEQMMQAGANAVGLGSVLARVPRQELIPLFAAALLSDLHHGGVAAGSFLSAGRLMSYRPFRLLRTRDFGEELRLFSLDGRLEAAAGQYAFLFLPGVGEKPFSVVCEEPAAFLIRRRGPFTQALFDLPPGAEVLLRGPYGAAAPPGERSRACIVAGGTGLALAPMLGRALLAQGSEVLLLYGAARAEEARAAAALHIPCRQIALADRGQAARVLSALPGLLGPGGASQTTFYNAGPEGFLRRAAQAELDLGAGEEQIYLSLETPSLCGVGLCGCCECGGRLLCKEGSFLSLHFLNLSGEDWPSERRGYAEGALPPPLLPLRSVSPTRKAINQAAASPSSATSTGAAASPRA